MCLCKEITHSVIVNRAPETVSGNVLDWQFWICTKFMDFALSIVTVVVL